MPLPIQKRVECVAASPCMNAGTPRHPPMASRASPDPWGLATTWPQSSEFPKAYLPLRSTDINKNGHPHSCRDDRSVAVVQVVRACFS